MNKKEYYNTYSAHNSFERKHVQELLHQWKIDNNYTCKCVVHHRDDTEECRRYNEEHYELWGFNEDGTFEYGKYVVFMTRSEHRGYHNKDLRTFSQQRNKKISIAHFGDRNVAKRPDVRAKLSESRMGNKNPMYGKHMSQSAKEIVREKTRIRMQALQFLYKAYKNNGGILQWNNFISAIHSGMITFKKENYNGYSVYNNPDFR